jgi:hypothetical protein
MPDAGMQKLRQAISLTKEVDVNNITALGGNTKVRRVKGTG